MVHLSADLSGDLCRFDDALRLDRDRGSLRIGDFSCGAEEVG